MTRSLKPCLSEKSRADGIHLKFVGKSNYQHNMMDDATRYWMASTVTVRKDTDYVSPRLEEGQKVAGKIPKAFDRRRSNIPRCVEEAVTPMQLFVEKDCTPPAHTYAP